MLKITKDLLGISKQLFTEILRWEKLMIIRLKIKFHSGARWPPWGHPGATLGSPWGFQAWLMERHTPLTWYSVQGGGSHYDEQIHGGERWEKEKLNWSCAVEKDRTEEVKAGRNTLLWVACLTTGSRWSLSSGCFQESCLSPWPYHSQILCGHPSPMLPSKTIIVPSVCVATLPIKESSGHVVVGVVLVWGTCAST